MDREEVDQILRLLVHNQEIRMKRAVIIEEIALSNQTKLFDIYARLQDVVSMLGRQTHLLLQLRNEGNTNMQNVEEIISGLEQELTVIKDKEAAAAALINRMVDQLSQNKADPVRLQALLDGFSAAAAPLSSALAAGTDAENALNPPVAPAPAPTDNSNTSTNTPAPAPAPTDNTNSTNNTNTPPVDNPPATVIDHEPATPTNPTPPVTTTTTTSIPVSDPNTVVNTGPESNLTPGPTTAQ